jgi:DMSO/TMAO reductase YedYZ molybdopterin-dependent catalytic subunit
MRSPTDRTGPRPPWLLSLGASIAATVVALALMNWARSAYQIRTLPERVMEWSLLFVPPDLFERGIRSFGTGAKTLALTVATVGLVVTLVVLGTIAVRRGAAAIALTAAGLWLFAMGVVMPITGGGLFATGLRGDVLLTNASYLGLALTYATVLLAARLMPVGGRAAGTTDGAAVTRRALLGGLASAAVAYAATLWLGGSAGSSTSSLPVASLAVLKPADTPAPATAVPTVAPPTATAGPDAAATKPAAGQPAAPTATPPPPTATAAPAVPTKPAIPPAPTPAMKLARDADGSLTASGRKPGELASLITPNEKWYITTKNAVSDPVVDPARWRLIVDGEVGKSVQLDLPLVYQLPSVEIVKTLECISNRVTRCGEAPFGCDLISNAVWKGARLRDVLSLAGGLKPNVKSIVLHGADEFTSSIPADPDLLANAVLAYEMNGTVLPIEHGYPARLLIPNRYGFKSLKWVVNIKPITTELVDWYGARGWTKDAIVRTMARIDMPVEGQKLPPGEHRIAGIAYAGARGVSKVEYSADGGKSWRAATAVEPQVGPDTWVRWEGKFALEPGKPTGLAVRSVDGTGARQVEEVSSVEPNGQAGMHAITVYPPTA